jgi:hypothetical protein
MMNQHERRVRKMRLGATSEALVRRGAILLEDALRTASLPEADGGRLLIVRSLFLGKIRSSQSPATISLLIEGRLRHLSLSAVYAEAPAAADHAVVYFHNEVDPYIRLAIRLARNESTDAWFWPLAVRAWRPGMPSDEAFRSLLYGVMQTKAGVAAAVAMLGELRERRSVGRLLSALRWQDGPSLLQAFGCAKPDLAAYPAEGRLPANNEDVLPAHWTSVLDHWTGQWGAEDARTAWLAAVALIAEKPGRLLDRSLALRMQQAIRQATSRISQPVSRPEQRARQKARGYTEAIDSELAQDSQLAGRIPIRESVIDDLPSAIDENDSPPSIRAASDSAIDERDELARGVETSLHISQEEDRSLTPDWLSSPQRSRFAGIFFLLPVISRLGISSLLDAAPHLVELDLPSRLLKYVARRIGVPDSDPIMLVLDGMCGDIIPSRCDFIAPAVWRQGLCQAGPWLIRRVKGATNTRALFDGSGRLALGLWRGRASEAVRELIGDLPIRRGTSIDYERDADILLKSWLTATRRWCRLYARLGLHDLVCRPGRVSATRTHIDVIFDHRHADIRVRKAGMDLDPGWIPWLGRVVLFHYLYGEDLDGLQ